MTASGDRPTPALWLAAALEGLRAFGVVAALGVGASIAVWLLAGPAYGFAVAVRIGALYLGAFHHVPIRIEGVFDIGRLTGGVLPDSDAPTSGASFIEIGIALLAVTLLAGWLLFRAGRRLAERAPEASPWRSLALGVAVAPSYAAAMLVVAFVVKIDEPVGLGRLVEGEVRVFLAAAQAFAFALAIAAVAGGLGGLWEWLSSRRGEPRTRIAAAALSGAWRMLWVGLALSYAGLFVAGIVQPDGAVALLTPSTARYFNTVFERPAAGAAILGHHLALSPNEAAWTLVPAAGGCDSVRGSEAADFLCYWRFPDLDGSVSQTLDDISTGQGSAFGSAPVAYLLFLLAPAAATVIGGREAARGSPGSGRHCATAGAVSGAMFAVMLGATALISGVSLSWGASIGDQAGGGSLWIGPSVIGALALGLAWGVVGGALGGATAGLRLGTERRSGPPGPR